jgi:hypothetical protein
MHEPKGSIIDRDSGSVIVIVMIMLALLTIIGISATNMSSTELKIANNDKNYKAAFYHAEGGVYAVAKWIGQVVDDNAVPASGDGNNITYLVQDDNGDDDLTGLLQWVMGYDSSYDEDMDLQFSMTTPNAGSTVAADFQRMKPVAAEGSSNQFASGASNHGVTSSVDRPYWVTVTSTMDNNATVTLTARYLKVDGSGGL